MNGLLHRLASQVLGPQPLTARARVAPRFSVSPEFPSETGSGAQPVIAVESPPSHPSRPQTTASLKTGMRPARRSMPDHGTTGPARHRDGGNHAQRETNPPAIRVEAHATLRQPPEPLLRPTPDPDSQAAFTQAPVAGQPRSNSVTDTFAKRPPAIPPPLFAAPPMAPAKAPAAARAIGERSLSGVGPGEEPSPTIRATGAQSALSNPAAQATEVHVHIGRVEVTALRDVPPARPRERSGRKPMSLDAYLAQRQKGSA